MSKSGDAGGPKLGPRSFVIRRSGEAGSGVHKVASTMVKVPGKSKWIIQANVAPSALKAGGPAASAESKASGTKVAGTAAAVAQMTAPASQPVTASQAPSPAIPSLPPGLEDLATRLVKPMIGEWLNENLPRMIGKALAGKG